MIGKAIQATLISCAFCLTASEETQQSKYLVEKTVSDTRVTYAHQESETELMLASKIKTDRGEIFHAEVQSIKPSTLKTITIKKPTNIFIWLERHYEYQQKIIAEKKAKEES